VDDTAQRSLLMPLGELFGSVQKADAVAFFDDHPELTREGGPCFQIGDDGKLALYQAMLGVETGMCISSPDPAARRLELVRCLSALDQFDQQVEAKSPARRIFGTVVEIGVDYFTTHPEAMGRDSDARRILGSFVAGLAETDFADGAGRQVLADLVGAALHSVPENAALISDDQRLRLMLNGVTAAVADDFRKAIANQDEVGRRQLLRRVGRSLLRGSAAAFGGNVDLFVSNEESAALIKDTLTQVLDGIKGQEDLFTNDSLEVIFNSALRAAAENAGLLTDKKLLQELVSRTTNVLADETWGRTFSTATTGAVLLAALEVTCENIETIVDPKRPQQQLLAQALSSMAGSLSTKLAGGGSIQDLLSHRQVVDLSKLVLTEVARHPEQLLGDVSGDSNKAVVAQVVASVARALGDEPMLHTNGAGFLRLVGTGLRVAVNNADQLVDIKSSDPTTNVLYGILKQVVSSISAAEDRRHLINRDVFGEIMDRVLPLASANLERILGEQPKIVAESLGVALELAQNRLRNRIDGANLPALVEGLLVRALWDELKLDDAAAVKSAALLILRAA
jgi:hypothetical protein